MEILALRGLLGIAILIAIAWLLSTNKKAINWRTVTTALAIQIGIAAIVLYVPVGQAILLSISEGVSNVIGYANAGIAFMFGNELGDKNIAFMFAFHVLPVIVFFSSLIAVLYYLGVMTWIIKIIGGGLQRLLRVSKPESLSAAANIFVGQTEAPLVIRPFLPQMTKSELFAVMVGGLSTVAGSIIAGLVGIGIELKYLIAASFMAAPGGLLMAKMLIPETEQPVDSVNKLESATEKNVNVIDAAAEGASNGLKLALNVGAMLMAFVALIALLNGVIGWFGSLVGIDNLSLQMILGYLFQPIAWIIGIPWSEAHLAGSFLGQKLIINEFVAYIDFSQQTAAFSAHSQIIITFALCGFANLSSIAILLGGIGSMAPTRRHDLAAMGLKAVLAASLANLMSATIAGLFTAIA